MSFLVDWKTTRPDCQNLRLGNESESVFHAADFAGAGADLSGFRDAFGRIRLEMTPQGQPGILETRTGEL